jgi:uncharacterized protein (DUF3820 family)
VILSKLFNREYKTRDMGFLDFLKKNETDYEELNKMLDNEQIWGTFFNYQKKMDKTPGIKRNIEYKDYSLKIAFQHFGQSNVLYPSPEDVYYRKGIMSQTSDPTLFKFYKLIISNENPEKSGAFDWQSCGINYINDSKHRDQPRSHGSCWFVTLPEKKQDYSRGLISIKTNTTIPFGLIFNVDNLIDDLPENYFHWVYHIPSDKIKLGIDIALNHSDRDRFKIYSA